MGGLVLGGAQPSPRATGACGELLVLWLTFAERRGEVYGIDAEGGVTYVEPVFTDRGTYNLSALARTTVGQ